jgi:hypothetical protein
MKLCRKLRGEIRFVIPAARASRFTILVAGVAVETLPADAEQDRSVLALTDGQIDRTRGTGATGW